MATSNALRNYDETAAGTGTGFIGAVTDAPAAWKMFEVVALVFGAWFIYRAIRDY